LTRWEAFAGKPVEVVAGQVGDETPLVLSEGHAARDEKLQVFGIHAFSLNRKALISCGQSLVRNA